MTEPKRISINGAPQIVAATTLAALLIELDFGNAKVATAVNGAFVPATDRANRVLVADDRVEIVSPRQGG